MKCSRQVLYLCCIGFGIVTISINIYFVPEWEKAMAIAGVPWWPSCKAPLFSPVRDVKYLKLPEINNLSQFLTIPKPLNYIPSSTKDKTVLRFDLDTPLTSIPPPDFNGYKTIVFQTRNFGRYFLQEGSDWIKYGDFFYGSSTPVCPQKCKYSINRTLAEDADAVMFNIVNSLHRAYPCDGEYPKKRRPDQIWVAFTLEPPTMYDATWLHELGHYFNWTFTYRLDSDIYFPYGYFYKLDIPRSLNDILLPSKEVLQSKTLVASLISNCRAQSMRDQVIAAMKRHIRIDQYGRCGQQCPTGDCRTFLAGRYKFILAFENSLCQDYITEKFFEAFSVGIVPVTYGLGDYSEVAPPGSYINALDFPNVSALTNYLKYLDENDDKYLEYFRWRQHYELELVPYNSLESELCSLCIKIWNAPQNSTQQITSFQDWWDHKRSVKLEKSPKNWRIADKILHYSKNSCIDPEEIFSQGFLN